MRPRPLASILLLVFAGLTAGPAALAALFEEDKRKDITQLYGRDPASLTEMERAIVQAAARTGYLSCESGRGTNGTLIKLPSGEDAVTTGVVAEL